MHLFEITEKGWLTITADGNDLKMNLNNVSRIQTWISNDDDLITGQPSSSFNISFELCSQAKFRQVNEKDYIDIKQSKRNNQTYWGFDNVFILPYLREDQWENAIKKIDDYLNK